MQESFESQTKAMRDAIDGASSVYRPSLFWESLNKKNLAQLNEFGYENFKRTVNRNYFYFLIRLPLYDQFFSVFLKWLKKPSLEIFRSSFGAEKSNSAEEKIPFFGTAERFFHKLFLCMLWEYTKTVDRENLLEKLEEPGQGNPLRVFYKGRMISQDICNSVLEYYSIKSGLPANGNSKLAIAELGAGYGRTAFVFLKAMKCKYVIFDIPPALWVSQRYLGEVFPEKRIFGFREFKKFSEISKEYGKADICFFTPNQMELLPKRQFDLFINISSLHEMTKEQIKNYFRLMGEYCRGFVYSKQWFVWRNYLDKITLSTKDYPVPANWEKVFFRRHAVQKRFFEAMYKVSQSQE